MFSLGFLFIPIFSQDIWFLGSEIGNATLVERPALWFVLCTISCFPSSLIIKHMKWWRPKCLSFVVVRDKEFDQGECFVPQSQDCGTELMGVKRSFTEERNDSACISLMAVWWLFNPRGKVLCTPLHSVRVNNSSRGVHVSFLIVSDTFLTFQTVAAVCPHVAQFFWLLLNSILGSSSSASLLNGIVPKAPHSKYFLLTEHTLLYLIPWLRCHLYCSGSWVSWTS